MEASAQREPRSQLRLRASSGDSGICMLEHLGGRLLRRVAQPVNDGALLRLPPDAADGAGSRVPFRASHVIQRRAEFLAQALRASGDRAVRCS